MIDLEKMANFIVEKMSSVNVKSEQCAKIRSPLSKCSECQEVCPQQKITFAGKKLILPDNCLECGLCASVCPTEALSLKEPDIILILNKIEQAYNNDGVVNISCRRNSLIDEKCVKISCIGSLRAEMLLVMRLYDYPIHIVLDEEQCRSCAASRGIDLFKTRVAQVEEWIEKYSLPANEFIQVTKPVTAKAKEPYKKHQDVDIHKRALFGSVFSGFRKMPEAVLQTYLGAYDSGPRKTEVAPKSRVDDSISLDRIEILKKYVYGKAQKLDQELYFLEQPVLAGICYFCKVCTILCPTGALEYCEEDQEILINSSRCSGCHLCVEVCFHNSLQTIPVSLESVLSPISKPIAKGYGNTCETCGKSFVASEAIVKCSRCQAEEKN